MERHPRASDFKWQEDALQCLQEATEAYIVHFLSISNLAAIHAKRVTLMIQDVRFIKMLQGIGDPA